MSGSVRVVTIGLLLSSDDDDNDNDNVVRRQCCHISSIWSIISRKYFKQRWVVQTLISQVLSSTHDTEERRKPASELRLVLYISYHVLK